jgi:predicted RecA/RadA family phage recombinase
MKNFVQPGEIITVPAPTGGANSGDGVLVGSLFGVATYSAPSAAPLEIVTEGVFDLPKAATIAFAVGDRVYWDATANNATSTTTGNKWVGIATEAALGSAGTARVRLNEIAI